jgi:hypothetical protein
MPTVGENRHESDELGGTMKNTTVKLACFFSLMTVAGGAAAVANAMTISAISFEDYFGGNCVSRQNNGITNQCAGSTNFSYAIPKGPSSAGYTITFTGRHSSAGLTSSPTVFSNAADGSFLAFQTNNATTNGNWSRSITFSSAQAPASSRLSAIVGLPENFQGALYGMSLTY